MPTDVISSIPFVTPSTVYLPPSVTIPNHWTSVVVVPATSVTSLPSKSVVYIVSTLVAVQSKNLPSTISSSVVAVLTLPPAGCACQNAVPTTQGYFTWVELTPVTLTVTVTLPTTIVSPVVLPVSLVSSLSSTSYFTVPYQSTVVIISYSKVPSSVPTLDIQSVVSTLVVYVTPATKPHTTLTVPSSWTDVVVVPKSWVSSTVNPTAGF